MHEYYRPGQRAVLVGVISVSNISIISFKWSYFGQRITARIYICSQPFFKWTRLLVPIFSGRWTAFGSNAICRVIFGSGEQTVAHVYWVANWLWHGLVCEPWKNKSVKIWPCSSPSIIRFIILASYNPSVCMKNGRDWGIWSSINLFARHIFTRHPRSWSDSWADMPSNPPRPNSTKQLSLTPVQ